MSKNYIIRSFEESDQSKTLIIFNRFAKESFAVYCEEELQENQFLKLLDNAKIILVIEEKDKVIGFGYISNYKPYPNFSHTGVLTYFILPEYTGKGIGTKLFNQLISKGREIGITNYLAHISSKNVQSLRFHEKLGFEEVGMLKNVAFKFGELIDIIWVQKQFGEQ